MFGPRASCGLKWIIVHTKLVSVYSCALDDRIPHSQDKLLHTYAIHAHIVGAARFMFGALELTIEFLLALQGLAYAHAVLSTCTALSNTHSEYSDSM